ncbi:hypothetical protein QBC46DRAFT_354656 [Diplogelasinospora grovesii]|uniref:COP9 signalosome complex subunit 6 n=1 Tax=Diplogelasinospora grovesii TaxID=303347 RepID=A0AAN6N633_9PEZI|nr:hypothetical protein QBC46DRAFT_354656 [Diplogelasinospora grovesii]
MSDDAPNPLLSTQKSTDSGLQVTLHPLPILEISDYIVRGYQRGLKGAVVGALLGQQNGREITIEHSFSCKSEKSDKDGFYRLDEQWFTDRLEQMRLVHKNPPLDLVGWYTLLPKSGPTAHVLPIHQQIISHNESSILLGFHVEGILHPVAGDPLPITIYESNLFAGDSTGKDDEDATMAEGEDKNMKDSEAAFNNNMVLKFKELPYTTETGEAEMIAMQFIREGGANANATTATATATATAVDDAEKRIVEQFDKKIAVDDGKGKRRAVSQEDDNTTTAKSKGKGKMEPTQAAPASSKASKDANLTKSEAEYMSALQTKYNAVMMMKTRLDVIVAYLQRLPPAYIVGNQTSTEAVEVAKASGGEYTTPSHKILRQIQALVTNMELATPAQQAELEREMLQEANDVHLISLISDLVSSMHDIREAGKKFAIVEANRNVKQRQEANSSKNAEFVRAASDLI